LQAENGCSARRNFRDDCLVREFRELANNEFEKFTHGLFFVAAFHERRPA
jgi:hypothetical protein